jgi:hypothetical protein
MMSIIYDVFLNSNDVMRGDSLLKITRDVHNKESLLKGKDLHVLTS